MANLLATEAHAPNDPGHVSDHQVLARAVNALHGVIADAPVTGGTLNPDVSSSVHAVTLPTTGPVTIGPSTSSAPSALSYLQGQRVVFIVTQPAAGGVSVVWDASWVGASQIRKTPGAVTIVEFVNTAATGAAPVWSCRTPLGEVVTRDGTWQQSAAWDFTTGLRHFGEAAALVQERPLDVVVVGDSISEGYFATTESETWISYLRRGLQTALNPPTVAGGIGYRPAAHGVEPTDNTYTADETQAFAHPFTLSGGAVAQVKNGSGLPLSYGMGYRYVGLTSSTAQATITFTGDRFWLAFATGPAFGNASVVIDGGAAILVNLYNASVQRSGLMFDSGALTRGSHTVTVKADNTAGSPANVYNVYLEGITQFDGDGGPGPQNMLPSNGAASFEDKGGVDWWAAGSQPGAAKQGVQLSLNGNAGFVDVGTHSLAATFDGTVTPPVVYGQYLPVVPTRQYQFTSRVKSGATSRTVTMGLQVYAQNADGSPGALITTLSGAGVATSTTAFTSMTTGQQTIPATGYMVRPIVTFSAAVATEVHYFDQMVVRRSMPTLTGGSGLNYDASSPVPSSPGGSGIGGAGVRLWDGSHSGFATAPSFAGPGAPNSAPGTFTPSASWADCLDFVEPDLILFCLSTNDASTFQNVTPAQYEANLTKIILQGRASCSSDPSIVVVNLWPWPANSGIFIGAPYTWGDYTSAARRVARQLGCGWLDVGAHLASSAGARLGGYGDLWSYNPGRMGIGNMGVQGLFYDGGVHPISQGHRAVGRFVCGWLLNSLGLGRGAVDDEGHLRAGGGIPAPAVNANAGTGAVLSMTAGSAPCSDTAGMVQLTTGSAAVAAGQQFAFLFARAWLGTGVRAVTLTPANAAAAGVMATVYANVNQAGVLLYTTAALAINTVYQWNYQVIG